MNNKQPSACLFDRFQPLPGIVSRSSPNLASEAIGSRAFQLAGRAEAVSSKRSHSVTPTDPPDSFVAPVKTFLRQRIDRIQRVQDGLTMAEQRVLNYLWERAYNNSSGTSRMLAVNQKQVAFATRLSVVSVRSNLRSLEAKRCIEETASFNVTEHLGRTYRIYSFTSILDRWRRGGFLWARHTRGVELLKSSHLPRPEESLAAQDSLPESFYNAVFSPDHHSSGPQDSSPPQDSCSSDRSPYFSATCEDRKESLAPQDSLPYIEEEKKQKQSSSTTTVSLESFSETLQSLSEFPAARLAADRIVLDMIGRVLANTPDVSDSEIAEFVCHKGREIKNPRISFMACLSAMVVQAMQGHRMVLYRRQRQSDEQHREVVQREEIEKMVECAQFFLAQIEQHLAGNSVDSSSLRTASGYLQFHLPSLPQPLQEQVGFALQRLNMPQEMANSP